MEPDMVSKDKIISDEYIVKQTGSSDIINQNVAEEHQIPPTLPLFNTADPVELNVNTFPVDPGNEFIHDCKTEISTKCYAESSSDNTEVKIEITNESICRICHDDESEIPLLKPCSCSGSMGLVHEDCLVHWLEESGSTSCEICGFEYLLNRKLKYTGITSIYKWIRNPSSPNDIRKLLFDIACFLTIIPGTFIAAWFAFVGPEPSLPQYSPSDYKLEYRKLAEESGPYSNFWTFCLLVLCTCFVTAYNIWFFITMKSHYYVWKNWQRRHYIVQLLPNQPSKINVANCETVDGLERLDDYTIMITPSFDEDPSKTNSDFLSSADIHFLPVINPTWKGQTFWFWTSGNTCIPEIEIPEVFASVGNSKNFN